LLIISNTSCSDGPFFLGIKHQQILISLLDLRSLTHENQVDCLLSVEMWLDKFGDCRHAYRSCWETWMRWVKANGWPDATPEGLVEFQEKAQGRDRYKVLDLAQRHVHVLTI
jgi:hypothetical protein